jgi:hypothetical protein
MEALARRPDTILKAWTKCWGSTVWTIAIKMLSFSLILMWSASNLRSSSKARPSPYTSSSVSFTFTWVASSWLSSSSIMEGNAPAQHALICNIFALWAIASCLVSTWQVEHWVGQWDILTSLVCQSIPGLWLWSQLYARIMLYLPRQVTANWVCSDWLS